VDLELWERQKQGMTEDFIRCYSEESGPLCALAEFSKLLKNYGLSLQKLHLLASEMLTAPFICGHWMLWKEKSE
jgi:hypothetical protein